jgi:hypothetical protein
MAPAFLGNGPSKPWPGGQGFKSFLDQELQGEVALTSPFALAPLRSQDALPLRIGPVQQGSSRPRRRLAAGKTRDRLALRDRSQRHSSRHRCLAASNVPLRTLKLSNT